MEGEQNSEPKDTKPKARLKSEWDREYVLPDEPEPLSFAGKPYSERFTADGIRDMALKRAVRQGHKEEERQAVVQFLQSLPEFQDSSKTRIEKVTQGLLKTLSQANAHRHGL